MAKRRGAASAQEGLPLVSAAARVLSILECLSRVRSIGLEELSRTVGLAKPTVYRFLQTLQSLGYARRSEGDRWALTLKLFNVGSRALDHLDLYAIARPIAEELAEELGETVHMGVLEDDSAVYVLKIESKYTIRMFSRVGRRIPLYCTAIGKVLLAYSDEQKRASILDALKLVAHTPKTITKREKLEAELKKVRDCGYALDDEEHEEGIVCIGAPVIDREGCLVASLSASWPLFRFEGADVEKSASLVTAAAGRISSALGYPPE